MTKLSYAAPLRNLFRDSDFPTDFLTAEDGLLAPLLNKLYFTDYAVAPGPDGLGVWIELVVAGEAALGFPGVEGLALVFGDAADGATLVDASFFVGPDGFSASIENVVVALRFPPSILKPVPESPGAAAPPYAQIEVQGSISLDENFNLSFNGFDSFSLKPVMIGNSGIIISAEDVKLDLSRTGTLPEIAAAGFDESFMGVYIGEAKVELPESFPALAPEDLVLKNCVIGTGGVSGRLEAHYAPVYDSASKTFSGHGAGQLFGIPFGLKDVDLEFKQNTFVKSEVKGVLLLPFFDEPVEVEIGIDIGGGFSVRLASAGPNGLFKLTKPDVLEIELESIGFELKDGVFVAKLSGAVTPLFGAGQGLKWPGFKVEELSIDSKGHVRLQGGWLDLRQQYELNFNGFKIGITKLGLGRNPDGSRWIGLSGAVKLVQGFSAGVSVEGLRITWYEDGRKPKFSFNGVGVAFEIPGVLRFDGAVSYRELLVGGEEVKRFDGDITLELVALKLEVDAKLVVGSASGPNGSYNFFAVYLGVELPFGISLAPIPLAIFGFAGLFASQMEPDKKPEEEWFEGWYKRPDVGVTDLKSKWVNRKGSFAVGCGVTVGTTDGYTFVCRALLLFVFPGPVIMLSGEAALLKDRTELGDDPMFRSLAVLDMRQKEFVFGLDAQYKQDEQSGGLVNIRAGVGARFRTPDDWNVHIGKREPREQRVRAIFFKFLEVNSYFMIDPKRLALGAWVGYERNWQYGPVGLKLASYLEGNAVLNWNPTRFHGDLSLCGQVEVHVFRFNLGLSLEALFAVDVFDPYHIVGSFNISFSLPKPLKSKSFDITLEWGPRAQWPIALPSPLNEVSIKHFKTTATWPLEAHTGGGPPTGNEPRVPLDCRPCVSFSRPVHDDALAGVNPQPPQPAWEIVGDPERGEGPARARYGLKEVSLLKWEPATQQWRVVAVAVRPPAAGERTLYGSWAPLPQIPSGAGQPAAASDRITFWSKTAFDYTRHGGGEGDDWFVNNFPTYPCVPQDVPDREVCCDFERLDRTHVLQTPWRSPEHPEVTLTWPTREPKRVNVLNPPDRGFTRALCFQPSPAEAVTVRLSEPARRVVVLLASAKSPERVCLDFRERQRSQIRLPFEERGVVIGTQPAATTVGPAQTTLGQMAGLLCTVIATPGTPPGLTFTLPCSASVVELTMSYQTSPAGTVPPTVSVFNSAGAQVATRAMLNPATQPELLRFEGGDLKRIRISNTVSTVFLHKLCFTCADTSPRVTAEAFDREGRRVGSFESRGDSVEVTGDGLTQVRLSGRGEVCLLKVCAVFGPDPREVAERQQMAAHVREEVARWSQEGEVLEPHTTYRLRVVTTTEADGMGELAGHTSSFSDTSHFDFCTGGPPGLTELSVPAGQDPDKFDSGLEDLTRYVRQTTPATVPANGEKPVMAKPFYCAYDIGVDFNENYVDLMYRISGRDLGLYLYDSNNDPARDAEGRLLVQSGEWGAVEELTLTEGERRWLALAAEGNRCLPPIEESDIVRDRRLVSAVAGRVLKPDTVYEARLIPLLLREGFAAYNAGAAAHGPSGALGRWRVRDEGGVDAPSHWEVRETPAPVARYLIQTAGIRGGNGDPVDPFKPGTLLLYGDDPALNPSHPEQPLNWTDYRLSAYLRSDAGGAVGLVFRHRGVGDFYRLSMDGGGAYRRLVRVATGVHTVLAEDDFACEPQRDYLVTVEAVGGSLRVYQDGAPVFDVNDAAHAQGTVGLYAHDNTAARFADVRVDDFRREARPAYRFQFTTSLFANFSQHLDSYQNETWRVAFEQADVAAALPAFGKAVQPSTPPAGEEARAYETLASALLGSAARQNPPEVQVTRADISGEPLAYLVRSPEPLDWSRTELSLLRTDFARTEPALPGRVKIVAVNFGPDRCGVESVVLHLREPMNLTGYRVESRLTAWPLSPNTGVVVNMQMLPNATVPTPWATYSTFGEGKLLPAGTTLTMLPGDPDPSAPPAPALPPTCDASTLNLAYRVLFSREVRVVAPDGSVLHSRHFLPDDDYAAEDVLVLRKLDGTGFFMVKPGGTPFALGQYRLKLTYRRDNRAQDPASRVYSQAGDQTDEVVTLDIPLQTL